MSNDAQKSLARLDERIAQLQQSLEERDWTRLGELNSDVRALIDPVMDAMEQRQLSPTEVQQRLRTLERFVEQADAEARQVRDEAKEALEQVGQNRKAASAYAKVSGRDRS
ncbi:SOS cell division inhibitor [Marinobacter sp.]|uniref:SOS cell division inhibitor n=1 Tax=Marinobacter sp. TaxID=50741 RepID=UPI003565C7AC